MDILYQKLQYLAAEKLLGNFATLSPLPEDNGLVAGHVYSLLAVREVFFEK